MRYAADLHLHSRYSSAVSKDMTLETIAVQARRKGIDLLVSGDCLQPQWLWELEQRLVPAEPGWFKLSPETEAAVSRNLSPSPRGDLRWVLGTEVSCAPPGTPRLGGIHHLLYFPSFDSARRFSKQVERYGDLWEGRPELRLTSLQLLELVLEHGDHCHMAPAHVMNPYFSCLGSNERHADLEEIFGAGAADLLAVETGLTSVPTMCRRISSLDRHSLFSNSDAHSPENIGRECTLLDITPGYHSLFAALRAGLREEILGTLKYPLLRTRYYLNRCTACAKSFEGPACPKCGSRLITGSRDYLEKIATRPGSGGGRKDPPHRQLLPLKKLLADFLGTSDDTQEVARYYERLLAKVGHERHVLTEAGYDVLAGESAPPIAKAILEQREADPDFFKPRNKAAEKADSQMSLF